MKIGNFFGKRKNVRNFPKNLKFFRKQGGNASWSQGGWTPLLTRVSSKCNVMLRSALSVTPRTFIWVTLAAPWIASRGTRHFPPPLLYTINSLVLEALRHRLLLDAHD